MSVSSDKGVTYAGLTRRLDYVDRLDAYGDGAIRQSYFLTPIGEAQRILEDTGCVLTGWKMIEGEFYQLEYAPFGIKLRFISNAHLNHPILVLAYWEADPEIGVEASVLKFFGSSGRSVDGS
ncbi:MAG TPA: hypothetical protein VGO98_00510, partial [Candidatus Saccharimonadales bacterium]|nr:hypothetical protein [Candidatus Saccharimonadales bacterium]